MKRFNSINVMIQGRAILSRSLCCDGLIMNRMVMPDDKTEHAVCSKCFNQVEECQAYLLNLPLIVDGVSMIVTFGKLEEKDDD